MSNGATGEASTPSPSGAGEANGGGGADEGKSGRLPRWTRQEILVLIQGKRVTESRGRRGGGIDGGVAALEPKWAAISTYCKRHGVIRGPVQCRKRWSNLAGDFKKIKEWERRAESEGGESFWVMRNDIRRERKLPGFFDNEVFDILDGGSKAVVVVVAEPKEEVEEEEETVPEAVFDSGRPVDEGLFSDGDGQEDMPAATKQGSPDPGPIPANPGNNLQPSFLRCFDPGTGSEKQPSMNTEKASTAQAGQKRPHPSDDGGNEGNLQDKLIEILEKNSRMLTAQLESQNINCQLDRNQMKDQADNLVGVLNKLADALGRIADKL